MESKNVLVFQANGMTFQVVKMSSSVKRFVATLFLYRLLRSFDYATPARQESSSCLTID